MHLPRLLPIACLALASLAVACVDNNKPDPAPVPDKWLGKWTGPEGTFLQLAGGGGAYDITIQNLDGPRTFRGAAAGDRILFERDGVKESVRATDGTGTGMKWLTDKKDCLTVRPGEGYCRG